MFKRDGISAVLLIMALVAGMSLSACSQENSAPAGGQAGAASSQASASSASQGSSAAFPIQVVADAVVRQREKQERIQEEGRIREEHERLERERKERERREAEERARQRHEAAWREKFPIDDYSNTMLIGDSLMQNATSSLLETLPGVEINADAGRTLERGGLVFEGQSADCGVLDHVRDDDGSFDRYVIGTGNNEVNGMSLEDAEEIVECLGPNKQIYFITMCSMGNANGTDTTNESIYTVAEENENVHVIDWYGLVMEDPSYYLSDGIHARRSREGDYADLIKEGLDVIY